MRIINYLLTFSVFTAGLTIFQPVRADHGPNSSASAAGGARADLVLPAGHAWFQLSHTLTRYQDYSPTRLKEDTLAMNRPGAHIDTLEMAGLSRLTAAVGLPWDLELRARGGLYRGRGVREGLLDYTTNYNQIYLGNISGLTDPEAGLKWETIPGLALSFLTAFPLGKTTRPEDEVPLSSLTVQNRTAGKGTPATTSRPHILKETPAGATEPVFSPEPGLMPGLGAYAFEAGLEINFLELWSQPGGAINRVRPFAAFRYRYFQYGNDFQAGALWQAGAGLAFPLAENLRGSVRLDFRSQKASQSYREKLENTGGRQLFFSTGFYWFPHRDLGVFLEPSFTMLELLNGTAQGVESKLTAGLSWLLHFEEHGPSAGKENEPVAQSNPEPEAVTAEPPTDSPAPQP